MLMDTPNPLLLTLSIDGAAHEYFNTLRQKYFPADRNFLDAHAMLFHQLPADEESIIIDIETIASQYQPMMLKIPALSSIGNGVAFKIASAELQQLHRQLQANGSSGSSRRTKTNCGRTSPYKIRLHPMLPGKHLSNYLPILNRSISPAQAYRYGNTRVGPGVL